MTDSHCTETWKDCPKYYDTVLAQPHMEGKYISLPYFGEELMVGMWYLLKKDKEGLSPPPLSPSDYKNVT